MKGKVKERISAITLMRGMGVLGVLGIHVGGMYLENPSANLFLLNLYDEVSRYAVPIFFFLSAFGLFYKLDLNEKFDYLKMLRRRLKAVLIPYITWSLFYLHHTAFYYDTYFPTDKITEILFFGLAKYHIYFLVILIWFYILMPLWIFIVKNLNKAKLFLLLLLQIAVNYYFCYSSELYLFQTSLPEGSFLQMALMYRLNYWVIFYAFIFLFGGYLAQRADEFKLFLQEKSLLITTFFVLMLLAQSAHFISLIKLFGRTPLEAVYTAHQLSPVGILYTIAACLFFFYIFTYKITSGKIYDFIKILGKHSYFIYLIHPLFLTMTVIYFASNGIIMTSGLSVMTYVFALLLSLFSALVFQKIANYIPLLGLLIIGKYK